MTPRRLILLIASLGVLLLGALGIWLRRPDASSKKGTEEPPVQIIKEPATIANRTFDPAEPPPDMPPLRAGEIALCDSDFLSDASVAGDSRREDATHATVTIRHVKVTLQLNVTIWLPTEVTQHVIEHEQGHREISDYYYRDADKLADEIAETYIGKQVEITGTDLTAESSAALHQMAADITNEYNKELNPEPTQLLYDTITDHSRNETAAKDAVTAAINNAAISAVQPPTNPGN